MPHLGEPWTLYHKLNYPKGYEEKRGITVRELKTWPKVTYTIFALIVYKTFPGHETVQSGFSRRAGDRRFSPCTKVYHAGYKFWIHFIFGTTLNVSTKETKRFLLSAYKVLCKCRICSYKCCRFSKFPGGACSRTLLDDPPHTSILSPPTMLHLGEPCTM